MAGQLVGDLIAWRMTPAAEGLSDKEFIVLLAIADRVVNPDKSRLMRKFKGDECSLYDRLCLIADTSPQVMKKILQKLADRGLEVRVELKKDRLGRPVYAHRGHEMDFRFPELPMAPPFSIRALPEAG